MARHFQVSALLKQPTLYLVYRSELPTSECITTDTVADDTAILTSHPPAMATELLEGGINDILIFINNNTITRRLKQTMPQNMMTQVPYQACHKQFQPTY